MSKPEYEVLKVLTLWNSYDCPQRVGFLLRSLSDDSVMGYSFTEAWERINKYGATNCMAVVNNKKLGDGTSFTSYTISPINGLPEFDDEYWFAEIDNNDAITEEQLSEELLMHVRALCDKAGCFHS